MEVPMMQQALFDAFMFEEAKDFHLKCDLRYDDILKFVLAQDGYVTLISYTNLGQVSRSLTLNNFLEKGIHHATIDLCSCGKTWTAKDTKGKLIGGQKCGMTPLFS
jgi:hypothetical protein